MPHAYCLTGPNFGDIPHFVFNEIAWRIATLLSRLARNPKYREDVLATVDKKRMPFLHATLEVALDDEETLRLCKETVLMQL